MEKTEDIQKRIFYLNGYYFTQGSYFPDVNQIKNHFWFEIMKDDCDIASDEWFIPVGWQRGETVNLLKEKDGAVEESKELLSSVEKLKGEIEKTEYDKLLVKFKNLAFVAELWRELAYAIFNYVKYFETREKKYHAALRENLKTIDDVNAAGIESLGTDFYNYKGAQGFLSLNKETDSDFTRSLYGTFLAERSRL